MKYFIIISTIVASLMAIEINVPVQESFEHQKEIIIRKPVQECYNVQEPVSNGNSLTGTVIGGVAGGILGHQVKGKQRTTATIVGTLLGSYVGNKITNSDSTSYKTVRRCKTSYIEERKTVTDYYKNVSYFHGHKFIKLSKHPLEYMTLIIKVK